MTLPSPDGVSGDPVEVQGSRLVAVGAVGGVFERLGLASGSALAEWEDFVFRGQVTGSAPAAAQANAMPSETYTHTPRPSSSAIFPAPAPYLTR